ncbi:hypothetical protein [Streptomyces lateritius]|uniref:hypothetical protein n=1 Tax=Streptomyces lateritius TaxID=67313 RepID=UPI0016738ACD|nr:hypothetical protein [Streptomyces lateritius]GGU11199.1 hypothetical protein GCM10010272_65400 [Streptomyces lateritius]
MNQPAPRVPKALTNAINDASYWTEKLPAETSKLVRRIRRFNAASAILSAVTGLAVWPIISESPEIVAQVLVSAVSFTSAALVALPTALGMREQVEKMINLSEKFSLAHHELLDAKDDWLAGSSTLPEVRKSIQNLQAAKVQKAALGLKDEKPNG